MKNSYQSQFVHGGFENIQMDSAKPKITMCNYCCKLGHTSLECRFRNGGNKLNVTWVPKTRAE